MFDNIDKNEIKANIINITTKINNFFSLLKTFFFIFIVQEFKNQIIRVTSLLFRKEKKRFKNLSNDNLSKDFKFTILFKHQTKANNIVKKTYIDKNYPKNIVKSCFYDINFVNLLREYKTIFVYNIIIIHKQNIFNRLFYIENANKNKNNIVYL